jgi:hypothetical protein
MKERYFPELDRRQFLTLGGAAAATALLGGPADAWPGKKEPPQRLAIRTPRRAKVALVFTHIPTGRATWPTMNYDYDARRKELSAKLRAECPGTEFTKDFVANKSEDADPIIKENPDVDGFVVYIIGIWTHVADKIIRSGKPTVVIDDLYAGSGELLGPGPVIRKEKLPAALVASSNFDDVKRGVHWLEVIAAMKGAKIINIKNANIRGAVKNVADVFGTTMVQMDSDELNQRYEAADNKLAKAWADYWMHGATSIVEAKTEDIVKAGKMHVAFVKAVEEKGADAVTMDCLGLYYSNKSRAYPCLSFFEMLNQGMSGICEADVDSTVTAMLMRYLNNRPGFVSDPVIDTATGEIIYAHCVMSNKVYGPNGKANKYILRTHAEDRKGVSVQSLMPLGQPVTTLKVALGDRTLVIHTGTTTRNVYELHKACRTKLAAKSDTQALLRNWTRGWHRVTVYGDCRNDFIHLAQLCGLSIIEEDKSLPA